MVSDSMKIGLFLSLTLETVGIDIVVNWNDVIRQTSLRRFKAHKSTPPYLPHRFLD
jgi:hypothetical protein